MEKLRFDHKPYGLYEKYIKRPLDCLLAIGALVTLSPVFAITALLVKFKLGSPVIFTQMRSGMIDPQTGKERIFKIYKFRTMTDERDSGGNLLPDELRLTRFGRTLRATSLDEFPELVNIMLGQMSFCGPRPLLVRDMTFMTDKQRVRHTVKPGLSGLAQVNGRNDIDWEDRLNWDLKYVEHITFLGDMKIVFQTVMKAFVKREGITQGDMATAEDFGDYLLRTGEVSKEEYDSKQTEAREVASAISNT